MWCFQTQFKILSNFNFSFELFFTYGLFRIGWARESIHWSLGFSMQCFPFWYSVLRNLAVLVSLDFLFCLNSDGLLSFAWVPPPGTMSRNSFSALGEGKHTAPLVSHISGTTVLGCLISSVFKTIVSCIYHLFFVCLFQGRQ